MTNSKDTAKGSEHTSGPWSRNIKPARKYPTVFAGWNTHIAVIQSQGLTDEEVEANCDLIAAAPDLLAALEHVYNHLIGLHAYLLSCETSVIVDNLETTSATAYKHAELAEAAIRKAKGEEISAVIKKGRNFMTNSPNPISPSPEERKPQPTTESRRTYCHLCHSYFEGEPDSHGLGECVELCEICLQNQADIDMCAPCRRVLRLAEALRAMLDIAPFADNASAAQIHGRAEAALNDRLLGEGK